MSEGKYINRFRWITLISGGVLVLLLLLAWIGSTWFPSWKKYQEDYYRISLEQSEEDELKPEPNAIRQVVSPGLGRTDRCISCHLGLENPAMKDSPQPHTMHPGDFLSDHPVEQFGCTVCHGGQGRAVDRVQAFGLDPSTHWDFPLLYPPYIESSCGKCHLAIFSSHSILKGTETFMHGQKIFNREGCLGCHKSRGVGGIIGPDLTEQGEKTKHEYSFRNVQGEQTISNWLKEHFKDPEMVSPGSDMLMISLPEEELEALATFTMGLAKPDIAFDFLGIEALKEFRGERESISTDIAYSMICSACHGKTGEGKDYESYKTGVPAIFNNDFLRVASGEMIKFTLLNGRGSRQMASWLPKHSGLEMAEIDSIVMLIEGNQGRQKEFETVSRISGNRTNGQLIFTTDCGQCHGDDGSGSIGLPVNNSDFLSIASDYFLFNTIFDGRNINGMPSWSHYNNQEMADILAFIRTWGSGPVNDAKIYLPPGDDIQGSLQYHYLCSRCHGEFGEGNTGPAILNPDFQSHASDDYLYKTISGGRNHTAMFGWSTDVQGAGKLDRQGISDIISYMRVVATEGRTYIYAGANPGSSATGDALYSKNCSECHGESGEGITAPALNNQEFLSAATNGYLAATISLGRQGTRMPSWGNGSPGYNSLSAQERMDIVAFIRSWQRFKIRLRVQED
jgi:mono/diheme cytochrome c family protein